MTKMKEKKLLEKKLFCFQSLIALNPLIEDFQAQVKTIRPSAKWSMLFLF